MAKTSLARSGQILEGTFDCAFHPVVGTLIGRDGDGTVRVDYPGNPHGPLPARLVGAGVNESLFLLGAGCPPVALAFENGDRSRPLILGLVSDRCEPLAEAPRLPSGVARELTIDGRVLIIDAEQELILRCGTASIHLRRDGKVVVKGTEIVSRASGANKIKGGVVNIN